MTKYDQKVSSNFTLGIIGGGQLGKMLIQAASKWDINTFVLDPDPKCAAAGICTKFIQGSFRDRDQVIQFGRMVDLITFEIEHVNIDALYQLESEGKVIYPQPSALETIQDKGLQKIFYQKNNLPTASFQLFQDRASIIEAINENIISFPFVQKSRKEGYDGKGVVVIHSENDIERIFDVPSVVEQAVDIDKELAVIVAKNTKGDSACFSAVEMEFSATANLVEQLLCPANIENAISEKLKSIAITIIEKLDMCGILAVEFFLDKKGEIFINEVAPRPHNSGHQTIEGAHTSQFEQHLRAILNFPLGSTAIIKPSIMINILGEDGHEGPVHYENFTESLAIEGVNIHIYGKKITKPFRKMGHVTIVDDSLEKAKAKAKQIRAQLKAIQQ